VYCLNKKVVKSQFGKRVENGAGQRGIMVNPFLLAYQIGGGWQVEVAVVMISAKSTNFTLFSSQYNIKGDRLRKRKKDYVFAYTIISVNGQFIGWSLWSFPRF